MTPTTSHLLPRLVLSSVLAAATVLGGGSAQAAPGTDVVSGSVAGCGAPGERVRLGVRQGSDPNDLSVAQVKAGQERVTARLRKHHLDWNSHGPRQVTVDVRVHVITKNDGTGDVTDAQIRRQVDVLDAGYGGRTARSAAPTPFRFRLKTIDRTRNDDWYDWANPDADPTDPAADPSDDADAKAALHQGGWDDLNVYVANLGDGLLGYSEFPDETTLTEDGVVILNQSLPGGTAVGTDGSLYNQGDTLTHEAGHWLGLYHTFENGCAEPGDQVRDTPYQLDGDNIFECNEGADTCTAPGTDPVHDFMSYGDDPCLDRFTRGQALRMGLVWLAYRQPR